MSRRWIVVGCGSIGKRHLRNLRTLGEDLLVGVDPDPDRQAEAKAQTGCSTHGSLDDALAEGADVVVVALPNAYHADAMRRAVSARCHLLVEKPLASLSDDAAGVVAEARMAGLVGLMGSNWKFHPSFVLMNRLLQEGRIGRVLSARVHSGQYLPDWHPWEDYRRMYSSRSELGGGVLLDTHEIIYTTWLLGGVRRIAALAEHVSDLETDTEDTASLIFKMRSGAHVNLLADYNQRVVRRSYEFHGTEGTITWDIWGRSVRAYDAATRVWTEHPEPLGYNLNAMYLEQTRHFVRCLDGAEASATPLEEGLYVLRLTELAKSASAEGRWVDVPFDRPE